MSSDRVQNSFFDPDDGSLEVVTVEGVQGRVAGGGSQPVSVVRFPFSFDTPDLVLTGVPIYMPTVGQVFQNYGVVVRVTTGFDGSTPTLNIGALGSLTAYNSLLFGTSGGFTLNAAPDTAIPPAIAGGTNIGQPGGSYFTATDPVYLMVDDGSGGDPGDTAGEGEIIFLLLNPA